VSVVILIKPIETRTKDGTRAHVTGIDMTSGDPYSGTVENVPGKPRAVHWRVNGDMRDGYPGWNLLLRIQSLTNSGTLRRN